MQERTPPRIAFTFTRSAAGQNAVSISLADACLGVEVLLRVVAIFLPVPQPADPAPAVQPAHAAVHAADPSRGQPEPQPTHTERPTVPVPQQLPAGQPAEPPVKALRFSLSITRCRIACHDWQDGLVSSWDSPVAIGLDLPHFLLQLPVQDRHQQPALHPVQLLPAADPSGPLVAAPSALDADIARAFRCAPAALSTCNTQHAPG